MIDIFHCDLQLYPSIQLSDFHRSSEERNPQTLWVVCTTSGSGGICQTSFVARCLEFWSLGS